MNRIVILSALSLAFAFFAFVPAADAQGPQTYPACVYGVLNSPCYGGHDVCSPYASLEIPICVDIPGCHHYSCISIQAPMSAPGVPVYGPCVAGVTAPSCLWGKDVCGPSISQEVPFCTNIPGCEHFSCVSIQTGPLPVPVSGPCVAGYTAPSCLWGYDVCGPTFSEEVPFCTNTPVCPHWECD